MTSNNPADLPAYIVNDQDTRPWGRYIVTAVGRDGAEEYCEKVIYIKPRQVLSLQSHDLRRETWTVKSGQLTAQVGDKLIKAGPGDAINVPLGAIHCMANLTDADCVVAERQTGVCREDDIRRYVDAYNRSTEAISPDAAQAVAVYRGILENIKGDQEVANVRAAG